MTEPTGGTRRLAGAGFFMLLLAWATPTVAQDMVGPSTDPARAEPPAAPVEPPEEEAIDDSGQDIPVAAPEDTGPPAVEGEGDAERARAAEAAVDEAPAAAEASEDSAAADTAADATAGDSDAEQASLDELYLERWQQQMSAGDFAGAADSAEDWVEETRRRHGGDAPELVGPLQFAGKAFAENGDLPRAELSYRQAIAIAEKHVDAFHLALVEPLTGLGRAMLDQGNYEAAATALQRAKNITHRNLGIFNLEQEDISEDLTKAFVNLGEITQANREQRFVFGTAEKNYGKNSPELVPALQRWARWNLRLQRVADARRNYQRALNIIEDTYGPNDPRMIETLNMIAMSSLTHQTSVFPREGARALERVVEILKSQEFVDHIDLLRAQTRLGDWYMLLGSRSRSVDAYTSAVQTAREAGVDEETINAFYGRPQPLESSDMPFDVLGSKLAELVGENRYILVEFSVDARGKARDIRIVQDTVQLVSVARNIRERIRTTAFRPRFIDGQPAIASGIQMIFEFEANPGSKQVRPNTHLIQSGETQVAPQEQDVATGEVAGEDEDADAAALEE